MKKIVIVFLILILFVGCSQKNNYKDVETTKIYEKIYNINKSFKKIIDTKENSCRTLENNYTSNNSSINIEEYYNKCISGLENLKYEVEDLKKMVENAQNAEIVNLLKEYDFQFIITILSDLDNLAKVFYSLGSKNNVSLLSDNDLKNIVNMNLYDSVEIGVAEILNFSWKDEIEEDYRIYSVNSMGYNNSNVSNLNDEIYKICFNENGFDACNSMRN